LFIFVEGINEQTKSATVVRSYSG